MTELDTISVLLGPTCGPRSPPWSLTPWSPVITSEEQQSGSERAGMAGDGLGWGRLAGGDGRRWSGMVGMAGMAGMAGMGSIDQLVLMGN